MKFKLSKSFKNVSWYNKGPFETYPDRKTGAKIGVYNLNVDSFYVPYVQPENCGNRTDVRWLKIINSGDENFSIKSDEPFNFSVSKFSDIERAIYPFQLKEDEFLTTNIDYKITGVGDTPVPKLPKYKTYPLSCNYSIILLPE
jgi:beta-galactosidase